MSPGNQGVFQLLKEVTFHSSTAFFCGSFARHSSAFSGFRLIGEQWTDWCDYILLEGGLVGLL